MRVRFLAVPVVLVLLAGACGDDSGGEAAEDTAGPVSAEAVDDETDSEASLLEGVPEIADATQEGQKSIGEGGVHIYGTIDRASSPDIVADYQLALEASGWFVTETGGSPDYGGVSWGDVWATAEDGRYLNFNALGGEQTGKPTVGNLCVFPSFPEDTPCPGDDPGFVIDQRDERDDHQDDNGGPPPGVEGFIPDEAEAASP